MSPVKSAPAALTVDDEKLRAQYLGEVLDVLYPDGEGRSVTEYLVVPHVKRPRLLVPAGNRRIAAAAVRRYAEPQSRLGRFKRGAVVAALRTGMSAVLLRDRLYVFRGGSIDAYLSRELGEALHVSIHIGPVRANRKPVLQLLDPGGRTTGFAKVGTTALTRQLVKAETTALVALSHTGLAGLTIPRVRHAGRWRDHEVLVQSALPVWRPRVPLTETRLITAMREIAACCGTRGGPLRDSGYWMRLQKRLDAVAGYPDGKALLEAAGRIVNRAGRTELVYGAWHGDWAPWNMANIADTLLVWDWERFTVGVPVGYDALHLALQQDIMVAPRGDAGHAVGTMIARAPKLLAPFGVDDPQAVEVTALLYLVDLATRYVADRQAEAGARLGVLGSWLLPVLIDRVEAL